MLSALQLTLQDLIYRNVLLLPISLKKTQINPGDCIVRIHRKVGRTKWLKCVVSLLLFLLDEIKENDNIGT